jgi:3-keto-disaccharide hydrolase
MLPDENASMSLAARLSDRLPRRKKETSMKTLPAALLTLAIALATNAAPTIAGEWKPLFNGKNLKGWKAVNGPMDSWKAEDGVLFCTGKGGGGWLSTTSEYANFELELEYRLPPGGNSGVFVRAPHEGEPHLAGMEIQVLDDNDPMYATIMPAQHCGSVYGVQASKPGFTKKPGEWQKMAIVANGTKVKVTLNGTVVVDTDLKDHQDSAAKHPGINRAKGYVGLQNHGSRLDYRNLRIRELP